MYEFLTELRVLVLHLQDIVARARTGSGKTMAYLLPTFHKLLQPSGAARGSFPRALVLVPTRELCEQVSKRYELPAVGERMLNEHSFWQYPCPRMRCGLRIYIHPAFLE